MIKQMRENQTDFYDYLIAGSGFAGSITAMALANSGYRVCLLEKNEHPRFAIGESSTPIADMILRGLADRYNLPFLKKLSRYGEWQKNYPEVICGLKRGFSYYPHQSGKEFESDRFHSNELLVAASVNNRNSDTNWLRSDVDHFLVRQAEKTELDYFDNTTVKSVKRIKNKNLWTISAARDAVQMQLKCKWIIDATGSPLFSETFFGTKSSASGFSTNSRAIYTHFENAGLWNQYLEERNFITDDYPYNPDDSALHHITEEGWIWMLRFNNNLLSAGLVFDCNKDEFPRYDPAKKTWDSVIQKYPSLFEIFSNAIIAGQPGKFYKTSRLQRKLNKIYGDGWIALNHTAGFADPLHSTGIAHTLSGIEKVLNVCINVQDETEKKKYLKKMEEDFFLELSFLDTLISICYQSAGNFKLFKAAVMLYFIATIKYESSRLKGRTPETFLCAGDFELQKLAEKTAREINFFSAGKSEFDINELVSKIRSWISPFNSAGLMDPEKMNMYHHTAVKL